MKLTKQQFRDKFIDTKVYVDGKSVEIQKQLFKAGFAWGYSKKTEVLHTDKPFIFIGVFLTQSCDMETFKNSSEEEVTAEEILDVEIVDDEDEVEEQIYKTKIKAWVARDESAELFLYLNHKPRKFSFGWFNDGHGFIEIPKDYFPEIKESDPEPTEIELTIKIIDYGKISN